MNTNLLNQQLQAILGSIQKWENIIYNNGTDNGIENCPCCIDFYEESPKTAYCKNCPIKEFTGEQFCRNSPYTDWVDYIGWYVELESRSIIDDTSRELAINELNFLKTVKLNLEQQLCNSNNYTTNE